MPSSSFSTLLDVARRNFPELLSHLTARTLATEAPAPTPAASAPPPKAQAQYSPVLPAKRGQLNGDEASAYLSSILSLPAGTFPPELALQTLTHKSYRFVHRMAHAPPYTEAEMAQSQVSHNARLSFVGRRALAAYTAMFVHSSMPSTNAVYAADFLRGKDIEGKLNALRHQNNIGRVVGDRWQIGEVMRWDQNEAGRDGGHTKIKGLTVEAVLGGVFTHLGSPAAQRAYHLHILPLLQAQLRDPALIEAAERVRDSAQGLGGVLP
jgi:dsRNA-specific ribonuclease